MEKKSIVNRFGLVALMSLSLFASTSAFAAAAQGPQQVVVANTPAQPVPMVGLVKDSDAPARKPFQWFNSIPVSLNGAALTLTTVPLNQRLVIEDVSGYCQGSVTLVYMVSHSIANGFKAKHYFPATFWNGTGPASTPVRFYVDPGQDFNLLIGVQGGTGNCDLAVSGYFVDLP